MKMTLELIEFITTREHWRDLLSQPPYCIKITDDGCYTILSYNQIESDFNESIVRECRGLIIRNDNYLPVCVPFYKFGNYGEGYCPQIDWQSARILEKVDGSIIKVWHDAGEWHVSTNGMINAGNAPVNDFDGLRFDALWQRAAEKCGLHFTADNPGISEDCTYMFELCSPENRVVVPHTETKTYHIGTRNNRTLEEQNVDIGVEKPKEYRFNSVEECIEAAKKLPFSVEGYVVVDKHWNRVKIKSTAYVAAFHLKNNGVITTTRIIDLLRTGEVKEFLLYYPEYTGVVSEVEHKLSLMGQEVNSRLDFLQRQDFPTQKDFALQVKDHQFSAFFFEWRKRNIPFREWCDKMPNYRLAGYLEEMET
jgi:hypothetical protein